MVGITRKNNRGESGQTLVEFALVVPLLLLLVFGIIEFGRVYHAQIVVAGAAREGARKAAVTGDDTAISTAIENAAATLSVTTVDNLDYDAYNSTPPGVNQIIFTVRCPEGREIDKPVEVYVKTKIGIIVPIISSLIGTDVTLPAMAVMRIERITG